MPPLESTEIGGEIETPPPKTYGRRPQHGIMADWTSTLLQYGASFKSLTSNSGKESSMPSSTSSIASIPSLNSRQHLASILSSPSSASSFAEEQNSMSSSRKRHTVSNPKSPLTPVPKRKKGSAVALFSYVVILSMALLAYTEYQLWQLSEQQQFHNNIVAGSKNHTHSTMLRPFTGNLLATDEIYVTTNESLTLDQQVDNDDAEQDDTVGGSYGPILHIVHSRFMQNQPNLVHLGKARLHLFRHFFLKSLEEQSSKNFCCIIRTDPDLNPELKRHLVEMLQASNITHILVASNETPKSQFQDLLLGNIHSSDVWSGSLEDMKQYLHLDDTTIPSRIIETRLDADDGLHHFFVETIQSEANENYLFESQSWRLWCVANHAEWQYQSIWKNAVSPSNDTGTLVALQVNYCVTPGLSIAFLGDEASLETMPSTMNHEKLMHTRICKEEKKISVNCRSFVPMTMGALRARTPTSAGMLNLVYNGTTMNRKYIRGATKQKDIQGQLWWAVRKFFGFTKPDAVRVNEYLNSHMKVIAEENLLGQCTKGHSCKNSSQILLKSIVEGAS